MAAQQLYVHKRQKAETNVDVQGFKCMQLQGAPVSAGSSCTLLLVLLLLAHCHDVD